MASISLMVGPPGSFKTTRSKQLEAQGYVRVSQDDQGKEGHMKVFQQALNDNKDIVIDRLNFNKSQRDRYLVPAKAKGYSTTIIVLHVPLQTCIDRIKLRTDHPTIKDDTSMGSALNTFFSKYERVEDSEADVVQRLGWEGDKPKAVYCDIDGTLSNTDHRQHFVSKDKPKKDWKSFFDGMSEDPVHEHILDILNTYHAKGTPIVICTGRPDNYKDQTVKWLDKFNVPYDNLFMRRRSDSRMDSVMKGIALEFEILTRYHVLFALDDRKQVVDELRKRGIKVLQVAPGDF